jgi:hypothetical protein
MLLLRTFKSVKELQKVLDFYLFIYQISFLWNMLLIFNQSDLFFFDSFRIKNKNPIRQQTLPTEMYEMDKKLLLEPKKLDVDITKYFSPLILDKL